MWFSTNLVVLDRRRAEASTECGLASRQRVNVGQQHQALVETERSASVVLSNLGALGIFLQERLGEEVWDRDGGRQTSGGLVQGWTEE